MKRKMLLIPLVLLLAISLVAMGCPAPAPPVPAPPVPAPPVAPAPVEKPPVEKIVWKDAEYTPPASVASWVCRWFFDEVERRSEGRFECEHFWSAALCPAKEQPNGLKSGLFEATCFPAAYYPSELPLFNIGTLPCLVPLTEGKPTTWLTWLNIMNEWQRTPIIEKEFAKWNALQLCDCYPAVRSIMGKARISNLEDLKGKKIASSGRTMELLSKAGAVPVFLTAPDYYDAIAKGVVDACSQCCGMFYKYHIHEVSKYWTRGINIRQSPYAFVVSKRAYEALPGDMKQIFQEVGKEIPDALVGHWKVEGDEAVQAFKKEGIEFLEFATEDWEKLREMTREMWKERVDKLEEQGLPGKEAFNSLQDIIAKHILGYEPYYL